MGAVSTDFYTWSSTAGSNNPVGTDVIGSTLDDSLRAIQAAIKGAMDPLSSVAGTNTITATGAPGLTAYASGQKFLFIPANTNTAAATLNITPSGGSSLGAKNIFWNGAACSGGELIQNVPVHVEYDGTQFNILGPVIGTRLTNTLGSDVPLNNTANYFDGPSIAQGTVGTWFASGTVTLVDTSAAAQFLAHLWDGTTTPVIASAVTISVAASNQTTIALSGYIKNPAGNIRIAVKDVTSTSGKILANASGNAQDSTLSVIRIG